MSTSGATSGTEDPDLRVVLDFLRLRREKRATEALELLVPNAVLGTAWGFHPTGKEIEIFIRDEVNFRVRTYLDDVPITKIDNGTYQRWYRYNRGEKRWKGGFWSYVPCVCRELYFVKNGKIRCVCCYRYPLRISYV